eukprot:329848_1
MDTPLDAQSNKNNKSELLNKVPFDSKYLACGYIRNYTAIAVNQIPIVIIDICALFTGPLHRIDVFHETGKYIKFNKTNEQIIYNDYMDCHTAYGQTLINPSHKKKYIWKFRITKSTIHSQDMYIGIDEHTSSWYNDDFSAKKETINYSYGWNGRKYSYKTGGYSYDYYCEYNVGDIVSMKLDFSRKEKRFGKLSFSVKKNNNNTNNSKIIQTDFEYKTAFRDIPKHVNYKMAVSFNGGLSMELMDCLFCDYVVIKQDILNPKLPERIVKKRKIKKLKSTKVSTIETKE